MSNERRMKKVRIDGGLLPKAGRISCGSRRLLERRAGTLSVIAERRIEP
jgi:hypothetical protein